MSAAPTATGAKTVTDETFAAEVLASPRPVLVEFWAPWCPPCTMMAPVLDAIAAGQAGRLGVAKINADENPVTTQRYAVLNLPTLLFFSGGTVVRQLAGARSRSALLREFAELR